MSDTFTTYRAYLFSIAYRMLGSVMDAEDMVQETYLRWQRTDQTAVSAPKSYLASIITRLCIDHLRSARVQRETYVGPWLPEPLLTDGGPSTEGTAVMSDSLSIAFLVLLEQLTPTERAVFLLREVFDYPYADVAGMVGKSEANCRQILRRARQRVQAGRPLATLNAAPAQLSVADEFAQACRRGDMARLLTLLADDVVEYSDGGGQVSAATRPIHGADNVARFLLGVMRMLPQDFVAEFHVVNGMPGLVTYANGRPYAVLVLDVRNGRIQTIYNILNPDKLHHLPDYSGGADMKTQ